MALIDFTLLDDGTARAYLTVLPGNLLLGADVLPSLVIKHTIGGNLDLRLWQHPPFTEIR